MIPVTQKCSHPPMYHKSQRSFLFSISTTVFTGFTNKLWNTINNLIFILLITKKVPNWKLALFVVLFFTIPYEIDIIYIYIQYQFILNIIIKKGCFDLIYK